MHSTHTNHKRPTPKYFYHTPFSYVAFWLVLLMIVPMSGRIRPVPDAHADGANSTCEIICTEQSERFFTCGSQ